MVKMLSREERFVAGQRIRGCGLSGRAIDALQILEGNADAADEEIARLEKERDEWKQAYKDSDHAALVKEGRTDDAKIRRLRGQVAALREALRVCDNGMWGTVEACDAVDDALDSDAGKAEAEVIRIAQKIQPECWEQACVYGHRDTRCLCTSWQRELAQAVKRMEEE